jgi:hypothetical protein
MLGIVSIDNQTALTVRLEEDTVWLTQAQIVVLFTTSKTNVRDQIKLSFLKDEPRRNHNLSSN